MSVSVYTIHQAKFRDDRLSEVVVLCRDEPEPPLFFYEETVMPIDQVIECMLLGDLFYAQWGENCLNIEMIKLASGEESIEVVHQGQHAAYRTLAGLHCEERVFDA